MGAKIAFVIVAVVVLGIGLYAYQSGYIPIGAKGVGTSTGTQLSGFFQSLLSHSSSSTSSKSSLQFSSGGNVPPATRITSTIADIVISSASATINSSGIPAGYTQSQLSPYFHQIRFGGVSTQSISLSVFLGPKAPTSTAIDVTGWQIRSNLGGEYIPQAVNLYDSLGLNAATDILLKSGDILNIYPTTSPVNLRMNICIGYLPNKSQFKPPLPQNCPSLINLSQIQAFSGVCQNYIESLGGCQLPNLTSSRIPQNDYVCRDYLNSHFNYHSCFEEHQTDANFLSREVRVWMGRSPMDPLHDRVSLLDRNGLLVDYYSY
jgi:hypothetical protein